MALGSTMFRATSTFLFCLFNGLKQTTTKKEDINTMVEDVFQEKP